MVTIALCVHIQSAKMGDYVFPRFTLYRDVIPKISCGPYDSVTSFDGHCTQKVD